MARSPIFLLIPGLLALSLQACWFLSHGKESSIASLSGHWASTAAEPTSTEFGPAYLFRTLKVKEGRYSLRHELSADRAGHSRWVAMELSGGLSLGPTLPKPAGAQALDFSLERLIITPYTLAFVAGLNRAPAGSCGASAWRVGLSQDVVPTQGCPSLGFSLKAGDASPDLVRSDGSKLYLGMRPPNAPLFQKDGPRPSEFGPPLSWVGGID